MNAEMRRRPSAFVPPVLSLAALAIVGCHVAMYGPTPEADEGTAAHLWQLLMAAQLPFMALFFFKWFLSTPRVAAPILVLQIVSALAAMAPVYLLHL